MVNINKWNDKLTIKQNSVAMGISERWARRLTVKFKLEYVPADYMQNKKTEFDTMANRALCEALHYGFGYDKGDTWV